MAAKNDIEVKILNAGLKLMNQYGYGSLTLSELARQAKITKQRLYYHFPKPEDVLIALAEKWSQTGQEGALKYLAATHEVGAYKVLAVSEGMFSWMNKHNELSRLGLVIFQSSPHIKKLNYFMEASRNTGRERIRSILLQDKAFMKLSKSKLEDAVTAIHAVMYGFYFYIISMNDFKNLDVHQVNCDESLRRLIHTFSK